MHAADAPHWILHGNAFNPDTRELAKCTKLTHSSEGHLWHASNIAKKTTLLLKCYLSKPKFAKKTHTGSILLGDSSYGGRGWLLGVFTWLHKHICHHPFGGSISMWCYAANIG